MKQPLILCTTLPEEPFKRHAMKKHFDELGLEVQMVDGVQGISIGLRATNPYDNDAHGNGLFIHSSQIGCILSHRIALSVGLASGEDEFIIVEDDVKFCPDFGERWMKMREHMPSDAQIVQLGYFFDTDPIDDLEPVNEYFARCERYPFCTEATWWTREAAQKAISQLRPIDKPFDVMMIQRVYPFLMHYIAWPAVASQKSRSLRESKRVDKDDVS